MTYYRDTLCEKYDREIGRVVGCGLDRLDRNITNVEIMKAVNFFNLNAENPFFKELAIVERRRQIELFVNNEPIYDKLLTTPQKYGIDLHALANNLLCELKKQQEDRDTVTYKGSFVETAVSKEINIFWLETALFKTDAYKVERNTPYSDLLVKTKSQDSILIDLVTTYHDTDNSELEAQIKKINLLDDNRALILISYNHNETGFVERCHALKELLDGSVDISSALCRLPSKDGDIYCNIIIVGV